MSAIPEAEVVDVQPIEDVPVHHEPSRELARRPVSHEVIRPLDPGQVVQSMRDHQDLLRQILDPSDWQGQPDAEGSFVKKSGWRKIALAYNLTIGKVSEQVERDEGGMPRRATYTAYTEAANGRRMESSGHCSYDESRFSGPRGNTSKLENDMRATAETRAKNRAISDLIGMGKVSAEEVDAGSASAPPYGPPVGADEMLKLRRAVAYVLGEEPDSEPVDAFITKVTAWGGGYVPVVAMWAVGGLAGAVKAQRELASDVPSDAPPEPAPDESPTDATIAAGSVDPPDLTSAKTEADACALLREAGCICENPLGKSADGACPINGHGIPW